MAATQGADERRPGRRRRPIEFHCDTCGNLRPELRPSIWAREYAHATGQGSPGRCLSIGIRELLRSKARGCQICFAIYRGLELFTVDVRQPGPGVVGDQLRTFLSHVDHLKSDMIVTVTPGFPATVSVNFAVRPHHPAAGGGETQLLFCFEIYSLTVPGKPPPIPAFGPGAHVPVKPRSGYRARLIKVWLDDCEANHSGCTLMHRGFVTPEGSVPPRLLDLSGNPRSKIKLVDSHGLSNYEKYATLSHPWRRREPDVLHLTRHNIHTLMSSIRWSDLPAAWKDAVAVVSELGIRYLWIDALCVVQDDDDDVAWHAERGHEILYASHLTIAATRIQDVGASFLGPRTSGALPRPRDKNHRDPDDMTHHELALDYKSQKCVVHLRRRLCSCHQSIGRHSCHLTQGEHRPGRKTYPTHFKQEMLKLGAHAQAQMQGPGNRTPVSPLMSFAGPFVERMLARRTLHFHGSEIVFECSRYTRCECTPEPTPFWSLRRHLYAAGMAASLRPLVPAAYSGQDDILDMWKRVMHAYPMMAMLGGDESHRLVALTPLASLVSLAARMDMHAGILANDREQLTRGLLWQVWRAIDEPVPAGYETWKCRSPLLPTWSWVSIVATHASIRHLPTRFDMHREFRVTAVKDYGWRCVTTPAGQLTAAGSFGEAAARWRLRLRGKLMLGRISPKFRKHKGDSFVPASDTLLDYFIPEASPPAMPPSPLSGPPPLILDLHDPPPGQQGHSSDAGVPGVAPSTERARPQHVPRLTIAKTDRLYSLYESTQHESMEHIPNRASLHWDCDHWANEACLNQEPFHAYFLLLGRLGAPPDGFDIGLVLRRCPISASSMMDIAASSSVPARVLAPVSGNFERVGVFTVPTRKTYFRLAQVDQVSIV